MFKALYLTKDGEQFGARIAELDDAALAEHAGAGDVTFKVQYSTLNYKDSLAITNKSPVVRKWPMVAGIDGVGVVERSDHPGFKVGDAVLLDGWGVGETHWGCLAQKARVKGDWLIALPEGISPRRAMALGTAGYTAMLCALALREAGIQPGDGDVLVTGASGGVGSVAIAILAGWGYRVVASTGKLEEAAYLKSLGAADLIDRQELASAGKPLQKERWAAAVDTAGSHTLANVCAQTRYGGAVAACGLAQGMDFPATVAPFILRSVRLLGVDSVMAPIPRRVQAWARLASDLDMAKLDAMTTEVGLGEVFDRAAAMLAGKVKGRIVVDVNRG